MNRHLNDRQFADAVLASETPDIRQHLGSCPACAAELQRFRDRALDLRDAAVLWSVRQETGARKLRVATRRAHRPGWPAMTAAAALLSAAAAVTVLMPAHHAAPSVRAAEPKAAVADASADKALLQAVNSEVSEEVAPALQPLLASESTTPTTKGAVQ